MIRPTVKKTCEEVLCWRWHNFRAWEVERLGQDFAVHLIGVFVIVWWEASQHLIQKNTKGPPIYCLVVALTKQKLGRKILRGTAES